MKRLGATIAFLIATLGGGRPLAAQETEADDGAAQIDDAAVAHGEGLVGEAARILAAARSTSYSHRTHIDERTGRYEVDCSGFAGYLLRRAAPAARRELVSATLKRPLARDFVSFIAAIPAGRRRGHWARVARARELRPGDLVAWLRPADSSGTDTGHVMLVAGKPVASAAGELFVPIIDASALPHGKGDRRASGSPTGVGSGTIVLALDASGGPTAFRWAPERRFRRHDTDIVLGRVEE